jgi:ADP-heptose:LPS heptosyltransferase
VKVPGSREIFGTAAVHTVEHRISQFYWTGLPRGPIPRTQIFPQPDAVASVARVLAQNGIAPGDSYAVLQPGARSPGMRWPVGKFAPIARWLLETHGIPCVVNLNERDAAVAAEVHSEMRDCAVVPEPFGLRELIALVAGARFFVGNDSGPAHLAAAAGLPCIVIFGTTNPVHWRPWQTPHRVVQTGAVFESPRGNKTIVVREPRSIQSIGVGEVREACDDLLAERPIEPKPGIKID